MKYVCLGYYDKDKFDGMAEGERNAMFDRCFEYDDHLRANGHWAGGEARCLRDRLDPVLEKRQSGSYGQSLCGNQGTTRWHSRP